MTFTDHLGREYPSRNAMAKAWGLAESTLKTRLIKLHWGLERALTTPVPDHSVQDPNTGIVYPNYTALGKVYGLSGAVIRARLKAGYKLKTALKRKSQRHRVQDHRGVWFSSVSEMCLYWKINIITYYSRRGLGWSVEEALTTPVLRVGAKLKQPSPKKIGRLSENRKQSESAHLRHCCEMFFNQKDLNKLDKRDFYKAVSKADLFLWEHKGEKYTSSDYINALQVMAWKFLKEIINGTSIN